MKHELSTSVYPRWNQDAPERAPFAPSTHFVGLEATGRFADYTTADTWYPSWGADDKLYSPYTDGNVHDLPSWSIGDKAETGHATIIGSDPQDLRIENVGVFAGSSLPYGGRYPSASLAHDGVWYYGTYCLSDAGRGLNWDILGPFVGFRTSTDGGLTWTDSPHTPAEPIFGESTDGTVPVRMGAPHFVDFGKNMEHSPDGYAYLVGHGSRFSTENLSWISGDEIFLGRVKPSIETINDPASWEFFAGKDADGNDTWKTGVSNAHPIASWPGHMGCVTVTYFPEDGKYLMCVTDGWPTIKEMNSYVLESDSLTGVWRMVAYMPSFGKQAYFLNFPSKFISSDGARAWLCYSANFTSQTLPLQMEADPVTSRYAMCLLELTLSRPNNASSD